MQQANIHAVLGLTIHVQWQERKVPLVLYAQTQEGYQHLLKISSAVSIREDDALPWKWLEGYAAGCVALLSSDNLIEIDDWIEVASALNKVFGSRLFMGIARPTGVIAEKEEAYVAWCETMNITVVASQSCYFYVQKIILPLRLQEQ